MKEKGVGGGLAEVKESQIFIVKPDIFSFTVKWQDPGGVLGSHAICAMLQFNFLKV
jgi:hypothetical protein